MAGEQTVRGNDSKRPVSVKETVVPKIKEFAGGKLGEAICEGLIQNERAATSMVDALRQETSDKVAGVADETTEQVRLLRTETYGARGAVAELRKQFGEKATVSEVQALEGRVKSVEERQRTADTERAAALEAMSREVEVPTADGGVQKRVLKGRELMDHTFAELQGIKDTLNGITEQVSQIDGPGLELEEARAMLETAKEIVAEVQRARDKDNESFTQQLDEVKRASLVPAPPAEADDGQLSKMKQAIQRAGKKMEQISGEIEGLKAAVKEAFSNVDGKLQMIAMETFGDGYAAVEELIGSPSMGKKED